MTSYTRIPNLPHDQIKAALVEARRQFMRSNEPTQLIAYQVAVLRYVVATVVNRNERLDREGRLVYYTMLINTCADLLKREALPEDTLDFADLLSP